MPTPRVFISSTFYDLKYIRENLKFFVRSLGYEPIMSEEGSVYFNPSLNVMDACLAEIPSCQILVLIIGGRFGGQYRETDTSITNAEYKEAISLKIPIFALIEQSVLNQYNVYKSNKMNLEIDEKKIVYPAVDSPKIFNFIEEVREKTVNNSLVPFNDFEDIQTYLKQQWASMMYYFLLSENESRRVGSMLKSLSSATEKIEFMSERLVQTFASKATKLNLEFYDHMLSYEVIRDLTLWGFRPNPKSILEHETLNSYCNNQIIIEDDEGFSIYHGGPPYKASKSKVKKITEQYLQLRGEFLKRLKKEKITIEKFLAEA